MAFSIKREIQSNGQLNERLTKLSKWDLTSKHAYGIQSYLSELIWIIKNQYNSNLIKTLAKYINHVLKVIKNGN